MNSREPDGFLLGRWLVQPGKDRIFDGAREVHLEPKVMDLLVFLASRPGEVLTRQQIFAAVWGQEFVCDTTLSSSVAVLRRALDDDAHLPRFIETIPKRGYRLMVAPVASPSPAAAGERLTSRLSAAIVVALAVAVVTVAAVVVVTRRAAARAGWSRSRRRAAPETDRRLASAPRRRSPLMSPFSGG